MKASPLLLAFALPLACGNAPGESPAGPSVPDTSREFGDYWYAGQAEITSFRLDQARYGRMHDGHAVQIFVTEDFSRSRLHKLNDPTTAPRDAVKVLKLNFTRDFTTGIYPYKTMQSVFTPVTGQPSLKVTTTAQEWCGHVFHQLNRRGDRWEAEIRSYFDGEGERDLTVDGVFLEDEVWTRIRIDPAGLPTGSFEALPSALAQRLNHLDPDPLPARGLLQEKNDSVSVYRLAFPDLPRTLEVDFESAFPRRILGWRETFRSGFGQGAKTLTTTAVRDAGLRIDYWTRNRPGDEVLRERLNLHVAP